MSTISSMSTYSARRVVITDEIGATYDMPAINIAGEKARSITVLRNALLWAFGNGIRAIRVEVDGITHVLGDWA